MRSVFLGICACAASLAAADVPPPEPVVSAVWKQQTLRFNYWGRTSRYTCDGLRDKVRAMLIDVGASRDLKVTAVGCAYSGGVLSASASSPVLYIVFSSPVPRGAAAAADTHAVAAPSSPARGAPSAAFDASYQPFSFVRDAFRNFEIGDCELIEEFVRQIVPKLATRDVKQETTCVPYQHVGNYNVKGFALKALPARIDRAL